MSKLDQLVKGAPPPGTHLPPMPTSGITSSESSIIDPLASLPSSPPQIYLNLLILEASLRAQWLQLRTRRRQHMFFLSLLGLWNIWFGYALFLAPREDGSGVGGSVYWVVEVTEKLCGIGGIVTALLIWGTGQWERGIRWPRRFVGITNRGLRGFNCKLVVIKEPWWKELLSAFSFPFSYGLLSGNSGSSYYFVDKSLLRESDKLAKQSGGHHALPNINEADDTKGYEEDLAPGGDYVKLLLLPKPFSPNFRENWDIYRTEYWEKENERRKILRQKMKERERKLAKQQGGWLWWTGYRGWRRAPATDVEKIHHRTHRQNTVSKRDRSTSVRSHSHSRNSSRSATPTGSEERSGSGHTRKGSSASTISERRRKKALPGPTRLAPTSGAGGSRSTTPEVPSPLIRENSFTSLSSLDSEMPLTPLLGDADSSTSRSLRSSTREKSGTLKPPKRTDGSAAESDEK